jgi:hypothetical protein
MGSVLSENQHSIPTLIRMEKGEPTVAIGVYATALWLVGRTNALSALANPQGDLGALERDVQLAAKRHARKPVVTTNDAVLVANPAATPYR